MTKEGDVDGGCQLRSVFSQLAVITEVSGHASLGLHTVHHSVHCLHMNTNTGALTPNASKCAQHSSASECITFSDVIHAEKHVLQRIERGEPATQRFLNYQTKTQGEGDKATIREREKKRQTQTDRYRKREERQTIRANHRKTVTNRLRWKDWARCNCSQDRMKVL